MNPLTPTEKRAMAYLYREPASCASLGELLWGRRGLSNCSCPWARPAGKVLAGLHKRGLVEREVGSVNRYQLTARGRRMHAEGSP